MTFLTELARLKEKATKGPLMVYDSCSFRRIGLANTHKEVLWPCVSLSDGHPDLSGINRDDDLSLWMFLANHADAIEAALKAAEDLEKWLGKLADGSFDAQIQIHATDIAAEGTCQRLVSLGAALKNLNME